MKKTLFALFLCLFLVSTLSAQFIHPAWIKSGEIAKIIKFKYQILLKELAAAPTEVTGYGSLYIKSSDGLPYFKTGAGVEHGLATAVSIGDYLDLPEIAEPGTPAATELRLWTEDFHGFSLFSWKDDAGMVRRMSDSIFIGVNNTGSSIPAYSAVYAAGNDLDPLPAAVEIALAKADSSATMPCIGITIETIADTAYGRVMLAGFLEDVNTSAFSVGDTIYVSAATAGEFVTTRPVAPNIGQEMGTILVDHASAGAAQIVARTASLTHTMASHSDDDTYDISTTGSATVTKGFFHGSETTASPAGAFTINWTTTQVQRVTIGGAAQDITFTDPASPCRLCLVVVQDGTGGRTIDWTNEASILWPGGVDPVLSTTAGYVDVITFYFDGTNYHGVASYDFR
jgi:hypothetical protein